MKKLVVLLFGSLFLLGCSGVSTRHHSTSVVDFLYPQTKDPITIEPSIPLLKLPLRVGIAFAPTSGYGGEQLHESSKLELLNKVAENFKKYPFVHSIEVIPSAYLKAKGSFTNLDQIRTMYGVDVMALVSYDQIQYSDSTALGFTYWTILGAYVVPGEKNDTHTMLDTVVYDIASRKMLFRAPGVSSVKGRATPINLSEELRADSAQSFQLSAQDMIINLDAQLISFRQKVKEKPEEYKIVHSPGYSGGGDTDLTFAMVMLGAALLILQRIRRLG